MGFVRIYAYLTHTAKAVDIRTSRKTTTGTLLAHASANAFVIRQHLGHRSISSSQVYCTVSDRDASAVARSAFMRAF